MRRIPAPVMILLTLFLAAGVLFFVMRRMDDSRIIPRVGFQDAAAPLPMPISAEIDPRVRSTPPWQAARIPTADRFDPPVGSEYAALTYNAQKFQEMNVARGGPHLGDDLNGIGGMNSDLGDPVFSCADGLVLYSGEPSPGWGKTLVIAHRTTQGKLLHSMYAHLNQIFVPRDTLVARGSRIGTIGTSNGYYPAHLHFEIRNALGVDIGGGYGPSPLNRLDPSATVISLRHAAPDALSSSPLALMCSALSAPWTSIEIQGAGKFPGLQSD